MEKSIREYYDELGSDLFYKQHSDDYKNPHYDIIKKIIKAVTPYVGENVCDLCCGGGEVSKCLKTNNVVGVDPFTYNLYRKNTGNPCFNLSFKDIACGELNQKFDTIICCFALHLCETSLLPTVLWQLGLISKTLIVISPHKRPDCDNISGWKLVNSIKIDRVTAKIYRHFMP